MYLDLLSLLTQATQEVSLYLMEDLSMLCSVYLLLEVLEELVPDTVQVPEVPDTELVLEVLPQLAKDCHLLMAQEPEVSTLISTLEVLDTVPELVLEVPDTELVLEVPDTEPVLEVPEVLEVQVDSCSTES